MTVPATSRADFSLDYYALTYRDPTGEEAVRNLTPGNVLITWPDGYTIWIPEQQAKGLLKFLLWAYNFRASRKGHTWASPKKKNAGSPGRETGVTPQTATITKQKEQNNV